MAQNSCIKEISCVSLNCSLDPYPSCPLLLYPGWLLICPSTLKSYRNWIRKYVTFGEFPPFAQFPVIHPDCMYGKFMPFLAKQSYVRLVHPGLCLMTYKLKNVWVNFCFVVMDKTFVVKFLLLWDQGQMPWLHSCCCIKYLKKKKKKAT